jgi:hypothetical protein
MVTDTIKAAYLEELRFAKRQQWTITAAVVAFIAGALARLDEGEFTKGHELDRKWRSKAMIGRSRRGCWLSWNESGGSIAFWSAAPRR